jgi:glutamate racemase
MTGPAAMAGPAASGVTATGEGRRVLLFDSGLGGLTVARAVRAALPGAGLVYAADTAAFPYGAWDERALDARIGDVMERLLALAEPDVTVIACNTASTIALASLRRRFPGPFVGTVPAIKPAAAQTKSGVIGVLATPGTVKREYTQALIHTYAYHCEVALHGARALAGMAEAKLSGGAVDAGQVRAEIAPVFRERGGRRTDVVVLGCTHYPLLLDELTAAAPWPVTFIDPAPAIARRVKALLAGLPAVERRRPPPPGTAILTAGPASPALAQVYAADGFPHSLVAAMPRALTAPAAAAIGRQSQPDR